MLWRTFASGFLKVLGGETPTCTHDEYVIGSHRKCHEESLQGWATYFCPNGERSENKNVS